MLRQMASDIPKGWEYVEGEFVQGMKADGPSMVETTYLRCGPSAGTESYDMDPKMFHMLGFADAETANDG